MNRRYFICCFILLLCICFTGSVYPSSAPHVHLVNNGVTYDIYFAGTNFRNAFIYDAPYLINTYSSTITGYTTYNGTNRTVSFPVYDYGNMRINDTMPAQYIYFDSITECEFIGFTETSWWKPDINTYLLIMVTVFSFLGMIRRSV